MRITFLLPMYPREPAGGFKIVYDYANALSRMGHKITIIHPSTLPNWGSGGTLLLSWLKDRVKNIRDIISHPEIGWHYIHEEVDLKFVNTPTKFSIPDADIVIATAWPTAEIVDELPASKGKKYYFIQSYEAWNAPQERVDRTWKLPLHKIVISKWLFEKGIELGIAPNEMVYIPNAIDLTSHQAFLSIESREPHFCMLYHPATIKGAKEGIAALEKIKARYPFIKSTLFGTRDAPDSLPSWISYYKQPDRTFLIKEIYNRASIFLNTSHIEGWGLPSSEAIACGCALITTDNFGCREFAVHRETALIVPIKNEAMIAEAMSELIENDPLRIKLAHAGRKKISSFSFDHNVYLLENYLKKSLGQD